MRKFGTFLGAVMILCAVAGVAAAQRASVSGKEVDGTYRMSFRGKYKDLSNEIKILALGGGKLRFAMELVYPYSLPDGEVTVNMGELAGEASIARDTAVFISDEFGECKITFKFVRPGTLRVTQGGTDADCGFGRNVTAGGDYRKVSGKKPVFGSSER